MNDRSRTPRPMIPTVKTAARILSSLLVLAPASLSAQYDAPPPPAAYALENVTVVAADGTRTDSVTVVVRDGLIQALGSGIAVPGDARVLEGEELFLHPGLVDAHGDAEVTWPDARDVEDPDGVTAWSPPRSRQGFMPHRRVADHLAVAGAGLESRREAGIVASLVHADGGMAPGQAAVLVHRHGAMPWEVVERDAAGLTMSLRTAGGVYPSQLFGVIAYLRQAFLDAERYQVMRTAQAGQAGGFLPPGWDPDHEALGSAARGEMPVHFHADSDEDIRRGLDLQDQFGFSMVLVGGGEAWKLAGELVERRIPVLVSLDFPEPDDWDPETDTIPSELSPAAAREKEELEALWSNAARLAEAGVTFALTSGGGEADILDGLRKVVDHGLSPAAALAAVTTTPAEILGIPSVIRVREGHPATFMVTSAPITDPEAAVRYTFVEGRLTEGAGAAGGGSDEAPAGDLTGSWTGEMEAAGQEADLTIQLTQSEDGSLEGTMAAMGMPESRVTGSISGSSVTLRVEAEGLPEPIVLTGTLSDDGNTVSGGGSTPFGEIEFQVVRSGPGGWAAFLGGAR